MPTKARGFTLVELLVTIAVLAILLGIAVPSFKRTIQSNNMSTAVNTFMTDMRYARSEAIRRGGNVIVCRLTDPEPAAPSCAGNFGNSGKGWSSGWVVFYDRDGDGAPGSSEVLRVQTPLTGLDLATETSANAAAQFSFTATGRLPDTASAAKLVFGGANFPADLQRVLCVSSGGRARIAADGACGTSNE